MGNYEYIVFDEEKREFHHRIGGAREDEVDLGKNGYYVCFVPKTIYYMPSKLTKDGAVAKLAEQLLSEYKEHRDKIEQIITSLEKSIDNLTYK